MSVIHPRLGELFERALELPVEKRAGFLDACDDDVLRRELASLLDAHESAGGYFEKLADRLGVAALQASLPTGYRLERELGGGGMSRVFLAEEVALKRRVVIKTLPPEMAASVSADRFRREIALVATLQHPHIVPLLTANANGALLYYAMPFVAGESLRDRLASGTPLPLDDAVRIWRDVLDALAHAHASGVMHRDIKPANILLSGRNAMVTDFGIARAVEAATHASAHATGPVGTPAYMAPEQAMALASADHRADIYAAGLVMYEMLAGHLPFQGKSAKEFVLAHMGHDPMPLERSDIPPRLIDLVMQCLAKNPAARPTSAEAIIAALDHLSSGGRATTGRRLRSPLLSVVTAAAVLGVAVGGWWALSGRGAAIGARSNRVHTPPDSAVRLYQRAMTEQRRRTIEGAGTAMQLLDRAIAADSDYSLAWSGIAYAALFADIRGWTVSGRSPDSLLALAVRASQRALAIDSLSVEAWTVWGKVAAAVGPDDRGPTLLALRRALRLDSTYAEAWFELGLAEEEALHPGNAERAWLRAGALSPTNAQVLAFLGLHYLWRDDYDSAKEWADSAVKVDPTLFLARDAAAFVEITRGRPDIAIGHVEAELRARGHEPPLSYSIRAAALAASGNRTAARRDAVKAESLLADPRNPSKHEAAYLATAWAAAGDTARALRWLSAYAAPSDLHYQLHLKRDPGLRWIARVRPSLLTR